MSSILNIFRGEYVVPSIVGPMQYAPSGSSFHKKISYACYNWFLCSKHIEAIKKIDQIKNSTLNIGYIWKKEFHAFMIALEVVPIVGHIAAALEAIYQSCEIVDNHYCQSRSRKYYIDDDTFREQQSREVHLWSSSVRHNPDQFFNVPEEIKKDTKFARLVLRDNPLLFRQFPKEIQRDKVTALYTIWEHYRQTNSYSQFHLLDETLKGDESFLLACLERTDGRFFRDWIPEALKSNYAFCLHAVTRNNLAYPYMPEEFKTTEQLILRTFRGVSNLSQSSGSYDKGFEIFKDLPESVRKNTELVREILKRNGLVLQFLDERDRENKQIVKNALQRNYRAYQYVGENLKKDTDFFLDMMLNTNHYLFHYASQDQKKDREIVIKVIRDYDLFFIADPSIREDEELARIAISHVVHSDDAYKFLYGKLKDNKNFAMLVENRMSHGDSLKYVGCNLQDDEDFVFHCIQKSSWGEPLEHASPRLRNNNDFMLKCLAVKPTGFEYVANTLRKSRDFALQAVKVGVKLSEISYEYGGKDYFDKAFFIEALKEAKKDNLVDTWNAIAFSFRDEEVAMLAIERGLLLEYIAPALLDMYSAHFYKNALKKIPVKDLQRQWNFIPEKLKTQELQEVYDNLVQSDRKSDTLCKSPQDGSS